MQTCYDKKIEILAPAGGPEQLKAAVRAGADAVYLGLKSFNARGRAHNFDTDELRAAVSYSHARGVKVHVTLKTLIRDDEMGAFARELESAAVSGADAVIVQDVAAARMVKELCPEIGLHASTQMTVHNRCGVKELSSLGFGRAVLARELTLGEIEAICAESDIETEVFIHGALCMSFSGGCYLSSMIGGRSGNRGRCAQPCRLNFRCGGREYALSLKDMSHIDSITRLADAGVRSVKIEGRMKSPDYVAAAVTACRLARDGLPYDREGLKKVFSRGGFTDGYLTGKRTLDMFGRRSEEDVRATASAKSMGALYKNEFPGVAVEMTFTAEEGKPVRLEVCDGRHTASAEGGIPERAASAPLDESRVRASAEKTGGTPFYLKDLKCNIGDGVAVRGGELNGLRREALDRLLRLREEVRPHPFKAYEPPVFAARALKGRPALRVRARSAAQLASCDLEGVERVILPIGEIERRPETVGLYGERLSAEIPAIVFPGDEQRTRAALRRLREMGVAGAVCENLGAVGLAVDLGLRASGGHGLNIYNTAALEEYSALGLADATLSFELRLDAAGSMGGRMPRGIIGYGYLPLMRMRTCPSQTEKGCSGCSGSKTLVDRKGERFTVLCEGRRYSELLNSVPLYIADRPLAGLDFVTVYLTTEDEKRAAQVLGAFRSGSPPPFKRTTGLYFRTVE